MPDKGFKLIDDKGNSRRNFLKNSGLTVGGIVLGGAVGSLLGLNKDVAQPVHTSAPVSASNPNAALMFFTPEQYQITMAASERIFPKDENGPGAKDLNAAIYIDHQLASPWGSNVKDYMLGAFKKPEPTQGKQLKILRKDLFILGLKGINDYSNKKHKRKFLELEAAEQDEILVAYEKGEADPCRAGKCENIQDLR